MNTVFECFFFVCVLNEKDTTEVMWGGTIRRGWGGGGGGGGGERGRTESLK